VLLAFTVSLFRSRMSLQLEILALQHQLVMYHRSIRLPKVRRPRLLVVVVARLGPRWREVPVFVQPLSSFELFPSPRSS
jgi:hypothetical protein